MNVRVSAPSATSRSPVPPYDDGERPVWTLVAGVEVMVAAAAVLFDLLIPSLVVLAVAGCSLAIRRAGPASLGFHRVDRPIRMAVRVLAISAAWTIATVGFTLPVLEHLTGDRQDLVAFQDLEGNLALAAILVVLSWTLGAFCEEFAFRGFLLTRLRETMPARTVGLVAAVLLSSALFGLIHTEQGLIGVTLTTLDGILFSVLRLHYRTLWAAVLAHGFNNTIGIVAFFAVGPIYGLW